jgi:histo-blood group ABO system transferase
MNLLKFLCLLLFSVGKIAYPHLYGAEKKVGLCVMATGRYNVFAQQMIQSARQFFLKGNQVTYFVFTDGDIELADDITKVHQSRLGWPYDTMMRFEIYLKSQDLFEGYDYLFALDADMLFVADVGDEILGDLVGTIHPGYYNQRGTYETRRKSTACVRGREGKCYFAGGFYGGSRAAFLKLLAITSKNINTDLAHHVIAVWHDESHLNRYFIDNPPTVKLDPAYCYPENWQIPFSRKLLALDKNHAEMRK